MNLLSKNISDVYGIHGRFPFNRRRPFFIGNYPPKVGLVVTHKQGPMAGARKAFAAIRMTEIRSKLRQAIEPAIGHLKQDHRMNRCWLQGLLVFLNTTPMRYAA
jgi:hypothetical protein